MTVELEQLLEINLLSRAGLHKRPVFGYTTERILLGYDYKNARVVHW